MSGSPFAVLDLAAIHKHGPPKLEWVWEGFFEPGDLAYLHSAGGLGKSLLALGLVGAVARGESFLGRDVQQGSAVYIDAEMGRKHQERRLHHLGLTVPGMHERVTYAAVDGPFNLLDKQSMGHLAALLDERKPCLLVLDTFRALWTGEEKDDGQVRKALTGLRGVLQAHHAAGLLLGHDNRSGTMRGSEDINASLDARLHLKLEEKRTGDGSRVLRLINEKNRGAAEVADVLFTLDGFELVGSEALTTRRSGIDYAQRVRATILKHPGLPSKNAIQKHTKGDARAINTAVDQLAELGEIVFRDEGWFERFEPVSQTTPGGVVFGGLSGVPLRSRAPHHTANPPGTSTDPTTLETLQTTFDASEVV